MMKRIGMPLIVVLLTLPVPALSQTELIGRTEVMELRWGGVEQSWDALYSRENVRFEHGPLGQLAVILDDNVPATDENTDLLLHFNGAGAQTVSAGSEHYALGEVNVFPSEDVEKHGRGSAGFLRYGNSIKIMPLESSVFFEHDPLQSFSIDFHLFPTNVHDSIVVLSWYAPTVDEESGFSGVRAFFKDGRLHWEFGNVFYEPGSEPQHIVIAELRPTPLNEWHHHGIHYDSLSGLMTLTFDGRENNLLWLTHNRRESGNELRGKFSPYLGVPLVLGEHFLGYMDEFRIARGAPSFMREENRAKGRIMSDVTDEYRTRGTIKSDVIDLTNRGTKVVKLVWDSIEEQGTAIRVYCRVSNRYFAPDMEPLGEDFLVKKGEHGQWPPDPELSHLDGRNIAEAFEQLKSSTSPPRWTMVRNGGEIKDVMLKGRYVQWKAELYGTEGSYTPRLNTLAVVYEPDPPPTAPILLTVSPLNKGVELTWVRNKEKDVAAYRIYYWEQSRFYVGNEPELVEQSTGETLTYELRNLENDRVYFVSITAVDDDGQESGFSRELIARPSAVYARD